jgi:tetratricopeptide (TPR) repeat protein
MGKNASAVQSFVGSLLALLVVAILFFAVMTPRGDDPLPPPVPAVPKTATTPKEGGELRSPRELLRESRVERTEARAESGSSTDDGQPKDEGQRAFDAEDPDVQRAIGMIDAGNPTEALAVLEDVLKRDPKNEQALVEMAMIQLLDLKQPDVALQTMQRVLDVNPSNQVVLSELVSLYEDQGKVEEGLGFLTDVYQRSPQSTDVAYGIGQLLTLSGRDAEAITFYEKAASGEGNEVRATRDLAEAYARSGDSEKAIEAYDRAIAGLEDEREIKGGKGMPTQFVDERINYTKIDKARELIRLGDFDKAQALLDEVDGAMPGDESVMALRQTLNQRRRG